MMRTMPTRLAALLMATALLAAVGCSSSPERADKTGAEVAAAASAEASAEAGRSVQLMEGEPEVEKLGEAGGATAYRVGDLKVIHKPTPANEVVAARLYIRGGVSDLTDETAGVQQLAMNVSTSGGTESTPKDEYNAALDAIGASIYSFADRDYSGYGLKTVTDNFDRTWELFTETVLEPAMPKDEIALNKDRQIQAIKALKDDPDAHVRWVAERAMFEGHPYDRLQIGTVDNVEGFTRADLLAHQRGLLDPERMVLVVVGNISEQELLAKVKSSLGRLQARGYEPEAAPAFDSEPTVATEARDLPTTYVLGYFPAPAPGDEDYPAMLVATKYLRDRLFEEVRTKRNLTYAVSSGVGARRSNVGYLYVTAADPKTTLDVIFDEVQKLKAEPIPADQLEETLNVFLTGHYMNLETNDSQAALLAESELIGGDWKESADFLERVRAVTPEDVQRVAKTYFDDYRFGVVGPEKALQPAYYQP